MALAATARGAVAQCPDGTPPPCRGSAAGRAPANSIAVLYFANLSRDSADEYLADGLTDEIIVRLQHVQRLDVKSRYEVRRFRGSQLVDARSAGHDLHVAYLVTGSVRPGPSRMRVSYELVRASDGRTIASDIVDTTAADQWAITNAVALGIARQVAGRLAPDERAALVRSPSRDAQAVDLYRRGMYLADRGVSGDRFNAVLSLGFFQAAAERDTTFVDPWASMAETWTWLDPIFSNRVASGRARVAAQRALALDSASARASSALAYAMMTVDYDWAGAERVLRRAIALQPRNVESHLALSVVLSATGRSDEAQRQVDAAWAADSLNPRTWAYRITILSCARRYDELLRWSRHPAMPDHWRRSAREWAFIGMGQFDSALASAGDLQPSVAALLGEGRTVEAWRQTALLAQAEDDSARSEGRRVTDADNLAMDWAVVGDRDRALAALELSYRVRSGGFLVYLKYLPAFDSLRTDPRYHDLLRRMNLEQ